MNKKSLITSIVTVALIAIGCASDPKTHARTHFKQRITAQETNTETTVDYVSPKDASVAGVQGDLSKGTYTLGSGSGTVNPNVVDAVGRRDYNLVTADLNTLMFFGKLAYDYFSPKGGGAGFVPQAPQAPTVVTNYIWVTNSAITPIK